MKFLLIDLDDLLYHNQEQLIALNGKIRKFFQSLLGFQLKFDGNFIENRGEIPPILATPLFMGGETV